MATYINISQVTQAVIKAQGNQGSQDFDPVRLEGKVAYYLTKTDEMYLEVISKKKIDIADVPDFASDNMSHTAKEIVIAYFNYRFFEDMVTNGKDDDSYYNDMTHFKAKYKALYDNIAKEDITNNPDDSTTDYILFAPRAGFLDD